MNDESICPVCLSRGASLSREPMNPLVFMFFFKCEICGNFKMKDDLYRQIRGDDNSGSFDLTHVQRAVLSHRICTASRETTEASGWLTITNEMLNALNSERLPSPKVQAVNVVRYIGDEVSQSGGAIEKLPRNFHVIIGAFDIESAISLVKELQHNAILKIVMTSEVIGPRRKMPFSGVDLTLDGWEQFEAEKRGRFDGNYGFLAMQFDNAELDAFVRDVLKPAVKEGTGYVLLHMRDVGRAGIIDNIMRVQIRDAKFDIADLSHDNNGAYWEAGYAEGLGKPVIYICKKEKFDEEKTHFDTNHCTTVPWSRDDDEGFCQKLIATLRRSLGEVS